MYRLFPYQRAGSCTMATAYNLNNIRGSGRWEPSKMLLLHQLTESVPRVFGTVSRTGSTQF